MVMNLASDLYRQNVNSGTIPDYGLSTASAASTNTNEEGQVEVPVYQVGSFDPSSFLGGRRLQDVYGTAAMPYFDFARRIQTGTVTFDPADPYHREAADAFGYSPDAPGTAAMLAQAGGAIAQGLISKATSLVATEAGKGALGSFISPSANMEFVNQLVPAAKSFLPGYTSTGLAKTASIKAAEGLAKGTSLVSKSGLDKMAGAGVQPKFVGAGQNIGGQDFYHISDASVGQAIAAGASGGGSDVISSDSSGFFGDTFSNEPGGGLAPGTPTLASVGASFGIGLGVNLLMGQKPKEAVKSPAFSTVGSTIGTALAGPIGGMIGGSIGGMIGGRVICNELCRQGLLTRKDVILDYRFTVDYLTPIHVNGYHIWSLGVVRKLRKGKSVKLWHHIAKHRANEIAYIYGERAKPDYLGKLYRHIGEPLCYAMGIFCKRTDWSVLYGKKEI